MSKKENIEKFLADKKMAIAGVSANPKKFGYIIFKELREKGFDICPVNPKVDEIDGVKCYQKVSDIPDEYKKLFIVTPKTETDNILKQATEKGIADVWVQQTANTENTIQLANDLGINLIAKECIFMYADPVKGIHKFHRAIWKLFGAYPK